MVSLWCHFFRILLFIIANHEQVSAFWFFLIFGVRAPKIPFRPRTLIFHTLPRYKKKIDVFRREGCVTELVLTRKCRAPARFLTLCAGRVIKDKGSGAEMGLPGGAFS